MWWEVFESGIHKHLYLRVMVYSLISFDGFGIGKFLVMVSLKLYI